MMRRQFMRVKQIADQKFQRSEKSEVLTEELNAAEKRVELIKESCSASGKKLSACTQKLVQDTSERRAKKIPEIALAQCMEEWGLHLGESSVLGMTLVDCARVQEALASDLVTYKSLVEERVVEPLQSLLKTNVTNILKYRKQLAKLTSEMDSAKVKYQNAVKNSQQGTGNGNAAAAAKAQLLKEESEDSNSRVEQCRDALAAEMFNLISREAEISDVYVAWCQLQKEYHRKALSVLEASLPDLESQIRGYPYQPVFGCPLEYHLTVSRREIAIVIETCVCWLLDNAMEEEGLFRIGGSMTKIKKMKSAFDAGLAHLIDDRDPHNVAGVLKLYLRSLPEPLLTYKLYDDWVEAAVEENHTVKLQSLWRVVNSLPEANMKNLRYLVKYFAKLCQNSEVNKMSVQNIAIVIGPNLIWPEIEECSLGMNKFNLHSSIVDALITYSDWFFPGECEFYVSTPTSPRHIEGLPLSTSQLSLTAKLSNGDSAVDSMSSSPTNSSPKSPSPRVPIRPRKKAAPRAPGTQNPITRSVSCSGFQANILSRANAIHHSRLSQHSVSHDNLYDADCNGDQATANGIPETSATLGRPKARYKEDQPVVKPPRRHQRNGLPPVAERSHKSLERPNVPPPQRPPENSRLQSTDSIIKRHPVIDLDDINISVDSSGSSETYNDCQMSFMDDSDNEQESERNSSLTSADLESTRSFNSFDTSSIQEKTINKEPEQKTEETNNIMEFIDQMIIGDDDQCLLSYSKNLQHYETCHITPNAQPPNVETTSEKLPSVEETPEETPYEESDDKFLIEAPPVTVRNHSHSTPNENSRKGIHFFGGTPTWFDHYGDDKRQSNTVWFSSQEVDELSRCFENSVFEETDEFDTNFRTVIEVGNGGEPEKPKVSGTAIKLRVNSETQYTRL